MNRSSSRQIARGRKINKHKYYMQEIYELGFVVHTCKNKQLDQCRAAPCQKLLSTNNSHGCWNNTVDSRQINKLRLIQLNNTDVTQIDHSPIRQKQYS